MEAYTLIYQCLNIIDRQTYHVLTSENFVRYEKSSVLSPICIFTKLVDNYIIEKCNCTGIQIIVKYRYTESVYIYCHIIQGKIKCK